MMRVSKKGILAAGLLAGAAVMTGCAANVTPAATTTPKTAAATMQPATPQPTAEQPTEAPAPEDAPLKLTVDGKEIDAEAMAEGDMLLLPLAETAEALGFKAVSEKEETDGGEKRIVSLEKDESRITVSWTVSDNTVKGISWQKDGLLIPVDTYLKTKENTVYVPAAFFEEAMKAGVVRTDKTVEVTVPKPADTPETETQDVGENG